MFERTKLTVGAAAALALAGCGETIQERQAHLDPLCVASFSDYENSQRIWDYAGLNVVHSEATGNLRIVSEQDIAQAALASHCTDAAMGGAVDFTPESYVSGTISEQLVNRGHMIEKAHDLMEQSPTYYTRGLPVEETRREN